MSGFTTRRAAWGVGLVAAAALVAGYGARMADAAKDGKAAQNFVGVGDGYWLPAFQVTDLSGQRHQLSDYKGKVLVLHFWASWCPYCQKEIPKLTQLAKEFDGKGVRVLSVNSDQEPSKLEAFLKEHQLPYPVVADQQAGRSIFGQYGVSGIPVTFVVGRDGRVAKRLNGSADILGTVESALK